MSLKPIRRWAESHPFLFAPGLVGAATLLFLPGRDLLGKGHWALLYLLVISVVASVAGSRPSLVAAVVSFLTWDVFFLPPYSPELQPVERVWPLVNEAVANRYFRDLEEMMEAVAERCRVLAQDPETLRRHTLFHWWPRTKELA